MKNSGICLALLCQFFLWSYGFGQNPIITELERKLVNAGDSDKVVLLSKLVAEYSTINPAHADSLCKLEVALAEKLNSPWLRIIAYSSKATVYISQANLESALKISLDAQKIGEEKNNPAMIGYALGTVGFVYQKLRNEEMALKILRRALSYRDVIPEKRIVANIYNNIGNSFYFTKVFDSAMVYFEIALALREEIKDRRGVSYALNNMGNVFIEQGFPEKALEFYIRSLAIKEEIGEKKGIASANMNIAEVYMDLKRTDLSVKYAERGIKAAEDIDAKDFMLNAYEVGAEAHRLSGNLEKSIYYLKKHLRLKDSLFTENTTKKIAEMQAMYESEMQQQKLAVQEEKLQAQEARLGLQKILLIGGAIVFVVLMALSMLLYSNYKNKKITSEKLAESNLIIERKNKDITDSIKYALRIQRAILPDQSIIQKSIPDHFVYYSPRDIVSGDFYWFHRIGNVFIVASADCTGHGVPGAFMSLICVQLLNQIISDANVTSPENALKALDAGINRALYQKGFESTTDGMDIALAAIHLDKMKIQYSGAFRPLYLVRNGKMVELSANKFTIGGYIDREKTFQGHEMDLQNGDCIYLFTDGYSDQFGGKHGKKFMLRNFKKLLVDHWTLPMAEQKNILEKNFREWKQGYDQVDDILVMGMKV